MSFTKYEERGAYHWQELANRTPRTYSARLNALYAWFCGQAARLDPELVVDVGCGDAALTHLISLRTRGRVVGIEPEPRGIELATGMLAGAGSRVEVLPGRGEDLPFDDGAVSLVVMCEVVEHMDPVEPLLAEAARVLEPGGTLLASTPQWQKPELRPHHVREFKGEELRGTLAPFFEHVTVEVTEPPRLYDAYLGSQLARIPVNAASLAGLNPFRLRRPATPGRARWRELLATASRPRARSESR